MGEAAAGSEARGDAMPDADPRPFEAFYAAELRPVIALAYALSGSRWAAEELAQEAFLAAHRRWDEVGRYEAPEAWVRRVVINRSVSGVRRRVAEARAMARLAGRRQLPADLEPEDDAFWAAVRALPPRQAQAVALHYVEDRSVDDIARVLDIAPGTVKVHLHRGRQALAEALGLRTPEGDAEVEEGGP